METFRTIVTPSGAPLQRQPSDVFLAIGSCFAERMGQCLTQSRLDALVNAHGILYNPFSMSTAIRRLLDNNGWTRDDLSSSTVAGTVPSITASFPMITAIPACCE